MLLANVSLAERWPGSRSPVWPQEGVVVNNRLRIFSLGVGAAGLRLEGVGIC